MPSYARHQCLSSARHNCCRRAGLGRAARPPAWPTINNPLASVRQLRAPGALRRTIWRSCWRPIDAAECGCRRTPGRAPPGAHQAEESTRVPAARPGRTAGRVAGRHRPRQAHRARNTAPVLFGVDSRGASAWTSIRRWTTPDVAAAELQGRITVGDYGAPGARGFAVPAQPGVPCPDHQCRAGVDRRSRIGLRTRQYDDMVHGGQRRRLRHRPAIQGASSSPSSPPVRSARYRPGSVGGLRHRCTGSVAASGGEHSQPGQPLHRHPAGCGRPAGGTTARTPTRSTA